MVRELNNIPDLADNHPHNGQPEQEKFANSIRPSKQENLGDEETILKTSKLRRTIHKNIERLIFEGQSEPERYRIKTRANKKKKLTARRKRREDLRRVKGNFTPWDFK